MPDFQSISSFGVGGILAAFIFTMYRKDLRDMNAKWQGQSELLVQVVKENTAAITSLVTLMRETHERNS